MKFKKTHFLIDKKKREQFYLPNKCYRKHPKLVYTSIQYKPSDSN